MYMDKLNKDIFLNITNYLNTIDQYFFVSCSTGKFIGVSFLKYRDYYFRKISADSLKASFFPEDKQIITEQKWINCLYYYSSIERSDFINCELLDFGFMWLAEKMESLLKNTNLSQYQSQSNNYFTKKIIRKKLAFSTGLRDKVFIKNQTLVCSIYGCKLLGNTRRKIMNSLLLKALVG